jgi:hypothetical protein
MDAQTDGVTQPTVPRDPSRASGSNDEGEVETTEARRKRRETRAALEDAVARRQCRHCAAVGCCRIYRTVAHRRYIECTACGRKDALDV